MYSYKSSTANENKKGKIKLGVTRRAFHVNWSIAVWLCGIRRSDYTWKSRGNFSPVTTCSSFHEQTLTSTAHPIHLVRIHDLSLHFSIPNDRALKRTPSISWRVYEYDIKYFLLGIKRKNYGRAFSTRIFSVSRGAIVARCSRSKFVHFIDSYRSILGSVSVGSRVPRVISTTNCKARGHDIIRHEMSYRRRTEGGEK